MNTTLVTNAHIPHSVFCENEISTYHLAILENIRNYAITKSNAHSISFEFTRLRCSVHDMCVLDYLVLQFPTNPKHKQIYIPHEITDDLQMDTIYHVNFDKKICM